jgi:hypothetical protein
MEYQNEIRLKEEPGQKTWNEMSLVNGDKITSHVPTGRSFSLQWRIIRYCALSWRAGDLEGSLPWRL